MSKAGPRLLRALLSRETGPLLAVVTALAAGGALFVAHDLPQTGAPLHGVTVRARFDTTVLMIVTVLLVLRTAVRTEADQASGWLVQLFGAGASRITYGLGVTAAAFTSSAVVFVAAAVAYALGVNAFAGSSELLRALPRTLGGGLLLLADYAVYAGLLGVLLRRAVAVAFSVGALVVVPYALMTRHLMSGTVPGWLAGVAALAPPLIVPTDAAAVRVILLQATAGCLLLALGAHRLAGRVR